MIKHLMESFIWCINKHYVILYGCNYIVVLGTSSLLWSYYGLFSRKEPCESLEHRGIVPAAKHEYNYVKMLTMMCVCVTSTLGVAVYIYASPMEEQPVSTLILHKAATRDVVSRPRHSHPNLAWHEKLMYYVNNGQWSLNAAACGKLPLFVFSFLLHWNSN